VATLTDQLRVQPEQLADRVAKLLAQLKQAEKTIADLTLQQTARQAQTLLEAATPVGPVTFVGAVVAQGGGVLRALAIEIRQRMGDRPGVVCLVGTADDKPTVVVATTAQARELGLKAGVLVSVAATVLGGRGGGKDDLAQGGGSEVVKAQAGVDAVGSALAAEVA
jgi:alanyl-tRNA synthetase